LPLRDGRCLPWRRRGRNPGSAYAAGAAPLAGMTVLAEAPRLRRRVTSA